MNETLPHHSAAYVHPGSTIQSMNRSWVRLSVLCAIVYLVMVAYLCMKIVKFTNGHFVYAIDDPYIHLALAENIAHGHYGINPGEFSSPSSSALWPLLLVPFAGTAFHPYLPLALNLICGVISAGLIGYFLSRWPIKLEESAIGNWQRIVLCVLLLLVANLAGLTLLGMEHTLQVMLALSCAIGVCYAISENRVPSWCLVAAVLAPSVRYEDLSLTLAIAIVLAGLGKWAKGVLIFSLSLLPLAAFSLFLKSKGLPLLPLSVLVKGDAYNGSAAGRALKLFAENIYEATRDPERFAIVVLTLIFVFLAVRTHIHIRRYAYAAIALVGALQLLIGRFGWFGRYEVYAIVFLTVAYLFVLSEKPAFPFGLLVLSLTFAGSQFIETTRDTALSASEIYRNQYQMHRFVTEFYTGDYAVNDLGLVSFRRRPGAYVLDVYGLGSLEASRQTNKTAQWLEDVVQRHNVPLAMLWPDWFNIPSSWTPMAKMCIPAKPIILGEQCLVFYSTSPDHDAIIRDDLHRFETTLPKGIVFYFASPGRPESMWVPAS